MIMYVENPKEFIEKLHEIIKFSKLQDIIVIYRNQLHFYMLATIRTKIIKTTPLKIASTDPTNTLEHI